jgi:hypothetical protein
MYQNRKIQENSWKNSFAALHKRLKIYKDTLLNKEEETTARRQFGILVIHSLDVANQVRHNIIYEIDNLIPKRKKLFLKKIFVAFVNLRKIFSVVCDIYRCGSFSEQKNVRKL